MKNLLITAVCLTAYLLPTKAQTVLINFNPAASPVTAYRINNADGSPAGFAFGQNDFGHLGYAERYDFSGADSAVQIIGIHLDFDGTYKAGTTKQITATLWTQGPKKQAAGR